jgi:apolipoprotein N-acyltransferase
MPLPASRFWPLLLSLLGGLLLWAGWPVSPLTLLLFVAWVPLLFVEKQVHNWKRFLGYAYLHFLVWNILTTWWVWNASVEGAWGAFLVNSLVMTIPWILFKFTRRQFGDRLGYASLVLYWLSFEFLHLNWELSWPWLNLGNAFAMHPEWVQWYEYTGASGGTLWLLLSNLFAFFLLQAYRDGSRGPAYRRWLISFVLVLILPILLSKLLIPHEKTIASQALAAADRNVVVVQPNIDPYTEKFTGDIESQIQKLIVLSEQQIDRNTRLLLWPETAVPAQVREDQIKEDFRFAPIWSFLKRHPQINLLTGLDSYQEYGTDKANASSTARLHKPSGIYYDMFNTAALMEPDSTVQYYHKGKLVPGVESLPSFLNFMSQWFEDFGGTSGTLGRDSERKVFVPWDEYYKSAPIICYESIYGDYITEFVRNGANILTVITNDGWWDNTPGYRQHMNYARLRAIETRKWVARSANTGISCFIDPLGNVIKPQPWDKAAAIKMNIPVDQRQTFFVKYGDILSRTATFAGLAMLALLIGFAIRNKIEKRSR